MSVLAQMGLIAGIHVGFLVASYGSGFLLELSLPYNAKLFIWLGLPSIIAGASYYWTLSRSPWMAASAYRIPKLGVCATVSALITLYLGVFIAFNTYGA